MIILNNSNTFNSTISGLQKHIICVGRVDEGRPYMRGIGLDNMSLGHVNHINQECGGK